MLSQSAPLELSSDQQRKVGKCEVLDKRNFTSEVKTKPFMFQALLHTNNLESIRFITTRNRTSRGTSLGIWLPCYVRVWDHLILGEA